MRDGIIHKELFPFMRSQAACPSCLLKGTLYNKGGKKLDLLCNPDRGGCGVSTSNKSIIANLIASLSTTQSADVSQNICPYGNLQDPEAQFKMRVNDDLEKHRSQLLCVSCEKKDCIIPFSKNQWQCKTPLCRRTYTVVVLDRMIRSITSADQHLQGCIQQVLNDPRHASRISCDVCDASGKIILDADNKWKCLDCGHFMCGLIMHEKIEELDLGYKWSVERSMEHGPNKWTPQFDSNLYNLIDQYGYDWQKIKNSMLCTYPAMFHYAKIPLIRMKAVNLQKKLISEHGLKIGFMSKPIEGYERRVLQDKRSHFNIICPKCSYPLTELHLLTVGACCKSCGTKGIPIIEECTRNFMHVVYIISKGTTLTDPVLYIGITEHGKHRFDAHLKRFEEENIGTIFICFRLCESTALKIFKGEQNINKIGGHQQSQVVRFCPDPARDRRLPDLSTSTFTDEYDPIPFFSAMSLTDHNAAGTLLADYRVGTYISTWCMKEGEKTCGCVVPCDSRRRFNYFKSLNLEFLVPPWDGMDEKIIKKKTKENFLRSGYFERTANYVSKFEIFDTSLESVIEAATRNVNLQPSTLTSYINLSKVIVEYDLFNPTTFQYQIRKCLTDRLLASTISVLSLMRSIFKAFSYTETLRLFGDKNPLILYKVIGTHKNLKNRESWIQSQQELNFIQLRQW